jgi:hypothetical protein
MERETTPWMARDGNRPVTFVDGWKNPVSVTIWRVSAALQPHPEVSSMRHLILAAALLAYLGGAA